MSTANTDQDTASNRITSRNPRELERLERFPLTVQACSHDQPIEGVEEGHVKVVFVTAGWARLAIRTVAADVSAGSIVALAAGVSWRAEPVGHLNTVNLLARQDFIQDQLRWLSDPDPLMCMLKRVVGGGSLLGTLNLGERGATLLIPRLCNLLSVRERGSTDLARLAVVANVLVKAGELLSSTSWPLSEEKTHAPSREVATAARLLHEQLDHPWTVGELARSVALSESQLSRLFREQLRISPAAFLWRARTDRMAQLLASGAVGVGRAATDSGWRSPSAASRAFRRRYGLSPSDFAQLSTFMS